MMMSRQAASEVTGDPLTTCSSCRVPIKTCPSLHLAPTGIPFNHATCVSYLRVFEACTAQGTLGGKGDEPLGQMMSFGIIPLVQVPPQWMVIMENPE